MAQHDAGPEDVREACYRLCGAMRETAPWYPSVADLRHNLIEARHQHELLAKAIAQSEAALAAYDKQRLDHFNGGGVNV